MRMGTVTSSCVIAALWLATGIGGTHGARDWVLDATLLTMSSEAAVLSDLAYDTRPEDGAGDDYDSFTTYTDDPDRALVAKKEGVCYGIFRGSDPTLEDWSQNFDTRPADVCRTGPWDAHNITTTTATGDQERCCRVTQGFYDAYHTTYQDVFEADLRACAASCRSDGPNSTAVTKDDHCDVVLAGHSQGGAVAVIAALSVTELRPLVLTFGQPPVLLEPVCPLLDPTRVVRYVNSVHNNLLQARYFDPVPFLSDFVGYFVGHTVLLSGSEHGGAAWLGLNFQTFATPQLDLTARSHASRSYASSIRALTRGDAPLRCDGFTDGTTCADADFLCRSDRCDDGVCQHQELNCAAPCNEASDCLSQYCVGGGCAEHPRGGPRAVVETGCPCAAEGDCTSRRCEYASYFSTDRRCRDKLGEGASCNEDNDCRSGDCSWLFVCTRL